MPWLVRRSFNVIELNEYMINYFLCFNIFIFCGHFNILFMQGFFNTFGVT